MSCGARVVQTVLATGLLKTPRLLRLLRVARRIDQYSEYGASVLLLMMATFTLFAHWLACGFYALASYERPSLEDGIGYLNKLAYQIGMEYADNDTTAGGPDIRSRYITSLYFTFTIMTSVGFGNVAPVTNIEKVFSIFAMILGCELLHHVACSYRIKINHTFALKTTTSKEYLIKRRFVFTYSD